MSLLNSVGFGTAALGDRCYEVVWMALAAGFRYFDTAEEHEHWYNPTAVGTALREYAESLMSHDSINDDECVMIDDEDGDGQPICSDGSTSSSISFSMSSFCKEIQISTKIPPWELTSSDHIRSNAAQSRVQLVGFCDTEQAKLPLDIYYIHAPACWKGWHTQCENPPTTLDLRSVWLALEAVVGIDHSSRRIGLSNVRPDELLDIIQFVQDRQEQQARATATGTMLDMEDTTILVAPPRLPDVVQSFADPIQPAEDIRQICSEHGIEFVSYSTLGTQHIYRSKLHQNPVLSHPIVIELANKYERSTAEVVLSWAIQHKMSVIPRSSRQEHILELARLLPKQQSDTGFLDANDLAQMDLLKNIV
jgi:diketogulonate reductase-like aldo/keto reductase